MMIKNTAHIKEYLPVGLAIIAALLYLGLVVAENIDRNSELAPNATDATLPAQLQPHEPENGRDDADINQLPKMHLFGRYSPAPEKEIVVEQTQPEIDLSALPKTKINLKLSGIGFTNNDARAYAIIVTPDGQHDHFVIGEEIVPGANVHLIEKGRVIITRDGNLEVLELPDTTRGNPNLPDRNARIARTNNRSPNKTQRN